MDNQKLNTKQAKAIPKILAARTHEEGCQAAGISKTTFYTWMQDETFKAEVERQRQEMAQEARGLLTQNLTVAVETLTGLLDTPDDRLRRLVAKDVVEIHAKQVEMGAVEARLSSLEAVLKTR